MTAALIAALIVFAGELAVAAGACAMIATLHRSTPGRRVALIVNGSALAVMGVLQYGFTHRPLLGVFVKS